MSVPVQLYNQQRAARYNDIVAHTSAVRCLQIGSRSGRVMVTGGDDKRVNLWTIGKAEPVMSLSGHTSAVTAVTLDSTEHILVAGGANGAIKMWDLDQTKVIRSLAGHKASARCVQFHPFGEFFASGSTDMTLKIWDVRRKGCVQSYATGHQSGVNTICMSPDGKWIATGGSDNIVKLWDLTAGRQLHAFRHTSGPITALAFHPNEFLLATAAGGGEIKFWDMESFEMVCVTEEGGNGNAVKVMHFMSDGSALLVAEETALKVYGWEPIILYDTVPIPWRGIADFSVVPESTSLIAGAIDQNLAAVWVSDLQLVNPFASSSVNPSVASSRDMQASIATRPHHHPFETPRSTPSLYASEPIPSIPSYNVDERALGLSKTTSHDSNSFTRPNEEDYTSPDQTRVVTPQRENPLSSNIRRNSPPTSGESEFDVNDASTVRLKMESMQIDHWKEEVRIDSSEEGTKAMESQYIPSRQPSTPPTKARVFRNITPERRTPQNYVQATDDEDNAEEGKKHSNSGTPLRIDDQTNAFVPSAGDQPLGLDIGAFFKPPRRESTTSKQTKSSHHPITSSATLEVLTSGHYTMIGVLNQRLDAIRLIRSEWDETNPRAALERLKEIGDSSVSVDILKIINAGGGKRGLNLEVVALVCSIVRELLFEVYEDHIITACATLKLLLKSFGGIISSTLESQKFASPGVDISREERMRKCTESFQELAITHSLLLELKSSPGRIGSNVGDVLKEYRIIGL